jgi:hypothetical protein
MKITITKDERHALLVAISAQQGELSTILADNYFRHEYPGAVKNYERRLELLGALNSKLLNAK